MSNADLDEEDELLSPRLVRGIPNLFAIYPQLQDIISCATLLLCMILWMPYYLKLDKGFNYSPAMDIFWISDIFVICGCVVTLISIWKKEKFFHITSILVLFIGLLLCMIAGAIESRRWCSDVSVQRLYVDECITYIVFMYCLFVPLSIAYVILLILYRSHYTFTNLIFMRSKRIAYLMFVGALMIVPVIIMLEWYYDVANWVWRAFWFSLICLDLFTWIIAFLYGFKQREIKKHDDGGRGGGRSPTKQYQEFGLYHPICYGTVTIIWIISFLSTLLWGFFGYYGYDYDTDDLLARYADYILMVFVNLWLIGELLGEDEGYVDIEIDYSSLPQQIVEETQMITNPDNMAL